MRPGQPRIRSKIWNGNPKLFHPQADNKNMMISSTSMENSLASMATNNAHQQVMDRVGVSVLKQQLDQQELQGEQIVQMINSTSLDGTGQLVDRTA